MIVKRHKVCDFCGSVVGVNNRYYILKSKNILDGYGGSFRDNKKHHICEKCMNKLQTIIKDWNDENE